MSNSSSRVKNIKGALQFLADRTAEAEETQKSTLKNQKHIQQDFFIADIFSAASFRSDIDSMALPLFALKGGETQDIIYDLGDTKVSITPTSAGRATIHDKDIWIYAISKLMAAINEGKEPSRTVRFTVYDYLVTTNRGTSGRDYLESHEALKRLKGTTISIESGSAELRNRQAMGFGLLESFHIVEEKDGRMLRVEMTLPNWLYRSINPKGVLKISSDYFRIRKPLNRRIYEVARKFCGNQFQFKISLENLYNRIGSKSPLKTFRLNIKELAQVNDLPDYLVEYQEGYDMVTFKNRDKVKAELEAKDKVASETQNNYPSGLMYFVQYQIPYEYKDTAQRLGLEYNGNTKLWTYEGGTPPDQLRQYLFKMEAQPV